MEIIFIVIDEVAARQGWLMFSVEVRWENERPRTYIILRGMGRWVVSKMEEVSTFIIIELYRRRHREYLSFVPPPSSLFSFIHSNPIVHVNNPSNKHFRLSTPLHCLQPKSSAYCAC